MRTVSACRADGARRIGARRRIMSTTDPLAHMPLDELEALLDINVYDLDINTRALMATSSEGAYHMCQ